MNALRREKRPISSSAPPASSSTPANPPSDMIDSPSNIATCGTPSSLELPCVTNRYAVTMRSAPWARGVQRCRKAWSIVMTPPLSLVELERLVQHAHGELGVLLLDHHGDLDL